MQSAHVFLQCKSHPFFALLIGQLSDQLPRLLQGPMKVRNFFGRRDERSNSQEKRRSSFKETSREQKQKRKTKVDRRKSLPQLTRQPHGEVQGAESAARLDNKAQHQNHLFIEGLNEALRTQKENWFAWSEDFAVPTKAVSFVIVLEGFMVFQQATRW